jgi:hypothetical protein
MAIMTNGITRTSDAMLGAISLISVVLGAAIASVVDRLPLQKDVLETGAGVLLLGGLLLLGSSLPAML